MVKGNILMIFVFYSCKLSVAKDLKTFERSSTTDLKHPPSIPHRVLWKTLKEILMAIDVMLLFVGILLGLFSHRIPYGVIAYKSAKGIEENLEKGAFTPIDPMVIICENTFGVINPQIPLKSYCLQYQTGYYRKPLKGYLRPNTLWLLFLKIPLGKSSHRLLRNSRKGIVENLENFPRNRFH